MSAERSDLAEAAHVLAHLGLVTVYGARVDPTREVDTDDSAADLATVAESDVVDVSLDASTLPPHAPAEAWAHLAVYRVMALDVGQWADYLLDAADRRAEVAAITKQVDTLTVEDAYAIQSALLDLRLARGERIVGAKLGLTSIAKQQQMAVSEPVYGWVTDCSLLVDGEVPVDELIHPRVEPEFVFRMAEDLSGPDVTAGDVLNAAAEVLGGVEVIDSRYEAFSFTLPDVIADNTSAARVHLGASGTAPRHVDLPTVSCTFEVDGIVTGTATGAALLGDPAACVAMLARHLDRYGRKLEAGWVVLAGAATDARPLGLGTLAVARYDHFAEVSVLGV